MSSTGEPFADVHRDASAREPDAHHVLTIDEPLRRLDASAEGLSRLDMASRRTVTDGGGRRRRSDPS